MQKFKNDLLGRTQKLPSVPGYLTHLSNNKYLKSLSRIFIHSPLLFKNVVRLKIVLFFKAIFMQEANDICQ